MEFKKGIGWRCCCDPETGLYTAEIGVTFKAWIFFAVIIMSNCQKPLESALKTFVIVSRLMQSVFVDNNKQLSFFVHI